MSEARLGEVGSCRDEGAGARVLWRCHAIELLREEERREGGEEVEEEVCAGALPGRDGKEEELEELRAKGGARASELELPATVTAPSPSRAPTCVNAVPASRSVLVDAFSAAILLSDLLAMVAEPSRVYNPGQPRSSTGVKRAGLPLFSFALPLFSLGSTPITPEDDGVREKSEASPGSGAGSPSQQPPPRQPAADTTGISQARSLLLSSSSLPKLEPRAWSSISPRRAPMWVANAQGGVRYGRATSGGSSE